MHLIHTEVSLSPGEKKQLHILEQLINYLDLNFKWSIMAATHIAYPDLAIETFSGAEPKQDVESFNQLCETKIKFILGQKTCKRWWMSKLHFQKKTALFSSWLWGPAADWYGNNFAKTITWDDVGTSFGARFSDGKNKFRYKIKVERCITGDGEELRNFLHRIKSMVDKGWLNHVNGIEAAQQNAERVAQAQESRQRYIDYSLIGLQTSYLQRKTQENQIQKPNATWNQFSNRIIQKDISV